MTRDYDKEYKDYHGKPEQIKRRASRNKARAYMIKNGKTRKGDSREVDHKNKNPLDNSPDNIRMRDKSANRRDQ
jgi:hypothetical protein